jgi:transposase
MSIVRTVVGGVDTHADVHVAAAVDGNGGVLGIEAFPADTAGYWDLLRWLVDFGDVSLVGVEGTGSYGVGLARFLHEEGIAVVEVDRPNRQTRRKVGKSDPTDAVAAARAALSGAAAVVPKTRNGPMEQMRVLLVARRSARSQRIQTLNQLRQLVFCAPEPIRVRFKDRYQKGLVSEAAKMRPRKGSDPVVFTTNTVVRDLARRIQGLTVEMRTIDQVLVELIVATAPSLLELYGVGPDTAASLLVTAGDNPTRLHSERSWAHLCGVTPIPASSGKTIRYRLNRGGDRNANAALHRIVLTRMSSHDETRAYVTRRRTEGLNTAEIMRCLKRYVARQVFKHLPLMASDPGGV